MTTHMFFLFFLKVSLFVFAGSAWAKVDQQTVERIREGVYINSSEADRSCVVIVKDVSSLINKNKFTIEVAQKSSSIYPDDADYAFFRTYSDSFSMSDLKNQILEKNGEFSVVTKDSSTTKNEVSGKLWSESGAIYWSVHVSKNTCIGLCTGTASNCTVRIQ